MKTGCVLLLAVSLAFGAGCATKKLSDPRIVGTWRLASIGDLEEPLPNYQAYEADGTWISWPTPWGEIQESTYVLQGNELLIGKGKHKTVISPITIDGDEWYTFAEDGGETQKLVYVREPLLRDPGWLPERWQGVTPVTPQSEP